MQMYACETHYSFLDNICPIFKLEGRFTIPDSRFWEFRKFCDLLTSGDPIMNKINVITILLCSVVLEKYFDGSFTLL